MTTVHEERAALIVPYDPVVGAVPVLVADAQRLFAEALARALDEYPDFEVAKEYPTTGEAAVDVMRKTLPDVVLIDYWVAGMGGALAARAMRLVLPSVRILFLAGYYIGPCQAHEAADAGALGFIKKSTSIEQTVATVRATLQDTRSETALPDTPPASEELLQRFLSLTSREIEILQMIATGIPTKDLVRHLSISGGTLKNHIHKILSKVGCRTQLEAVMLARAEGVISVTGPPWARERGNQRRR